MSPQNALPLAAQLARWQAAGLLSAEQVERILTFEGTESPPRRSFSPATTLSLIGALVLGLGLIALVAANWGTLPRAVKFAGLVLLTLSSYGLGYALRDRPGASWPGTGAALYLLGGVLFGAVLGFLAQGMQLGLEVNTLLALWGAGLLALAYGVRLPPALHLALPLGAVIPLLGLYGGDWGLFAGQAYGEANVFFILAAGLLFLLVAWWHDHRWLPPGIELGRTLGNPWAFWGPPLALGALTGVVSQWRALQGLGEAILPGLVLAAASSGLLVWGQRERRRAIENWSLLWLGLTLLVLCIGSGELLAQLLGGILGLGLALWGGKTENRRLINLGLVGVGLAVLSFYFSVFARLLDISLVLVGAGLLLLGLGYGLERTRRRLNAGGSP